MQPRERERLPCALAPPIAHATRPQVKLPVDKGVVLLDIGFTGTDPNHGAEQPHTACGHTLLILPLPRSAHWQWEDTDICDWLFSRGINCLQWR
jgi:hypothetical protein